MTVTGFYKPQVDRFYELLLKIQEHFGFQASQIHNSDETGVLTVHRNYKVLSVGGRNQVGILTSAERDNNVTVKVSTRMKASGHSITPMFIFPRKNG